jgi:hypothetical protein
MDLVQPGRRERRIELALPTADAVPFRLSVTGEKDLGDEDQAVSWRGIDCCAGTG